MNSANAAKPAVSIAIPAYEYHTPRFSVVVPAYNVEGFITNTINSLAACLTDEFELICVNDGSTDDTADRIDEALKSVKCHAYRADIVHAGVAAARNEGLRLAKGEYIAFVDGDDVVKPDYAEKLLEFTGERKLDAVFFGIDSDHGNHVTPKRTILGIDGEDVIALCYGAREFQLCNSAVAYKRDFLLREQLLYTPGCGRSEDIEFMLKALIRAKSVDIYPNKLYVYLWRGTSISNSYKLSWFDSVDAMLRLVDYARINGAKAQTVKTAASLVVYEFLMLRSRSNRVGRVKIRELQKEIDKNYPGQTRRVFECARQHLPITHLYRLALCAYRVCPAAFFPIQRRLFPNVLK